jgi:hypothetical protein
MTNDIDIEDLLKRYRGDPSPRVKRAVMSRYRHAAARRATAGAYAPFWRRAMPVYLAAVLIVIAAGASFFAGWSISRQRGTEQGSPQQLRQAKIIEAEELRWEVAENDIL